jgi:hypothetical protein
VIVVVVVSGECRKGSGSGSGRAETRAQTHAVKNDQTGCTSKWVDMNLRSAARLTIDQVQDPTLENEDHTRHCEKPRAMIDGHTEAVCAGPVNANQKRPIATAGVSDVLLRGNSARCAVRGHEKGLLEA